MHRSAKVAWYVAAAIFLTLAAGVGFVVNQTKVPPEAIQAAVIRNEDAIERAWQLPVASTFNREVKWQSNASLCGPASAANMFRSLGEAATSEAAVLAGTGRCWTGFCIMGLTLDELAEVTRKNTKRTITVLRDLSPDAFRQHLKQSNDPGRRYIINFSRKQVFGAGAGHHSPIGGYLEGEDLVFVLDVSRDFRPWLIEGARLFAAMDTRDGTKKRGLLLIE
jgi:hypothetical protein